MNNDQAVPTRHGWLTANLIAQLAFGLLAMTLSLPSMQDWPAAFNASQASVQLTFSGFIAAYGLLQLVYGPLSDRMGRKPVLMAGLVLSCLGSLLSALAPSVTMLVLARVIQGAGSAAGMVVARALIQDLFAGAERTRMMAFVGMAMGFCPPLAMLIGGQIHVRLGWRANFVVMTVLAAGLLLAAWRGLPDRKPQAASQASAWRELIAGYVRLAHEPAFLWFVIILSGTTATFYSFLGGGPIVLGRYGVPPELLGWYIMCIPACYILGNWLCSRFIHRWGDRPLMMLGQASIMFGLLLVLALGIAGVHTPMALALPLMFLGIGHGLLMPPTLAGTVGLIPALAGSAAAVGGVMQQLTGALGGFVVGLVNHDGPVELALVMLAFSLSAMIGQVFLFRLRRRQSLKSGAQAS